MESDDARRIRVTESDFRDGADLGCIRTERGILRLADRGALAANSHHLRGVQRPGVAGGDCRGDQSDQTAELDAVVDGLEQAWFESVPVLAFASASATSSARTM